MSVGSRLLGHIRIHILTIAAMLGAGCGSRPALSQECVLTNPAGSCQWTNSSGLFLCEEFSGDASADCNVVAFGGKWMAGAKCPPTGLLRCCENTTAVLDVVICDYTTKGSIGACGAVVAFCAP